MKRSFKKAVAFLVFLAIAAQTFTFSDPVPAKAFVDGGIRFVESEDYLTGIQNATGSVTVPAKSHLRHVSFYDNLTGIGSLTIEDGYESLYIYNADDLEELILPGSIKRVTLMLVPDLKKLVIKKGTEEVNLIACGSLKTVDIPSSVTALMVESCEKLESAKLRSGLLTYSQAFCPNLSVKIPDTVEELNSDDFSKITINKKNKLFSVYDEGLYREKTLIQAPNKEVVNIKKGTKTIGAFALCGCYAVTTVNIPESVTKLEMYSLMSLINVKDLKLPSKLTDIEAYAFEGLADEDLVIPASVKNVADNAFGGYTHEISLADGKQAALAQENGVIYTKDFKKLLYYPKDRSEISVNRKCTFIATDVFNGCPITELVIPEGVTGMSLSLEKCTSLRSIKLSSTVSDIDLWFLKYSTPDSFANIEADSRNKTYSSYDGCLYDKSKTTLLCIPVGKKETKIPQGCLRIDPYALGREFVTDEETGWQVDRDLTVEFPASIEEADIQSFGAVKLSKVKIGSTVADYISEYNDNNYFRLDYEFTDSPKKILGNISVNKDVQVKKGGTASVSYSVPAGLNVVKKFLSEHEGKNIYVKATFTSADKSIADVNKKTGKIKGIGKGTTVVKAKFELPDGTKKTIKINVTVK